MLLLQRGLCCFLAYDDPPKLTQNQWSILAIAGISNLFRSYDGLVSTVAVSQIQEDLHISEEDIGLVYAAVRFGIVPALLVAMLSDIHGRRKVLLISTGIYIVFTSSTGFTTNLNQFIGFQFIAKMFSSAYEVADSSFVMNGIDIGSQNSNDDTTAEVEPLTEEKHVPSFCLKNKRGLCCFLAYDDPPKLTQNQWSILAIAGISNLFRSYDGLVSTVAVSQIQEDLHISEEDIGLVYAAVRFGIVPALLVAMLSDIHGRRKVLLISTGIYIVFTSSTGFTTNLNQFIGFQFIAKMFSSVQNTVYSVLILEALNDENRGWAIGLYQSFSAFGGSIALMLFAVFGGFRWGWRVMYIVSFTELFLLRYMYRNLPESGIIMKAWAETVHVEERLPVNSLSLFREAVLSNLKPVYLLFLSYPKRFLGCTTIAAIDGFATAPADLFKIKFMQELHGLSPHDISMIIFVSGVGAILCFTLAGKLSDKYGRKPLLIGFKTLLTASIVLYYTVPGKW
eukprot:CAMPEP_0204877580 /NCGR_PEP_ID=MMETSP1348-20121228/48265_1 /ASSEMBLY_ACC=CAM_ASM_000700 /TAXON_ID=215587 /ORGANISM="Aplanochytrium stocchinoi, Strain GSBS06" /LENGTH=507 /DNA_ID=CAMNT_0052034459 /DNA_START=923 /DNA_END=2443 /DNA_ORIENTATION=+